MGKKHVLLTFYHLGLGGIQTKIIDIANYLSQKHNVLVTVLLKEKKDFERSAELLPNVQCIYCPDFFPAIVARRYYYFIILYVLFYRPHSVFVAMDKVSVILLKALQYLPFIATKVIVNIDTYLPAHQQTSSANITSYFPKASSVIAVSDDTYKDLSMRLSIPSPPLRKLSNWTRISQETRLPVFHKTKHFIYAGRLEAQKQPHLYIEFLQLLARKNSLERLDIYGDGSLLQSAQSMAQDANMTRHIYFHKPTNDVATVLSQSKYILLFSSYEGLPFILLEAMKYGCVVLCLDAPGTRDVVVDGHTGIMKSSLQELIKAYIQLEKNKKKYMNMRQKAFVRAQKLFSLQNCEVLSELLIT